MEQNSVKKDSACAKKAAEKVIRNTAEKWPAAFVARTKIREFSGGLISPGTAANLDSLGCGIEGSFKVGRQVAYPVESVVNFLIARLEG